MKNQPLHILLVEDNPGDARLIQAMLEESVQMQWGIAGFEIEHAELMRTALDELSRQRFDVVLLDLTLPDMVGLGTVQLVCSAAPDHPVVVLTGLNDEETALAAVQTGAQDYLLKGEVDAALLSRTIRYAIERKRTEEALRESEERFRTSIETLLSGFAIFAPVRDAAGKITDLRYEYINQAGCQINERSRMEHLGQTLLELMPGQRESGLFDAYMQVIETGESLQKEAFDFEDLHKDGTRFSKAFDIRAVKLGDGLAVTWRDVSERKQREAILQQRNQELALLNHASQVLNSTLELDEVLWRVLDLLTPSLGMAGSFWLVDPRTGELVCRQASGPHAHMVRNWRLQPGEGIVGFVAKQGCSLILPDVLADERHFKGVDRKTGLAIRSILSVPLKLKDKVIGVLQVLDTQVGRFKHQDLSLLESLASIAAIAVENAWLFQESQQSARQTALLNDITRAAISAPDVKNMLQSLANHLGEVFDADGAYISLWDDIHDQVIPMAAYGPLLEQYQSIQYEPGEASLSGACLQAGRVIVVEDVLNSPYVSKRIAEMFPAKALLGLPLIADGKKHGTALIGYNQPHQFTADEIALGERVAGQVALALWKAKLYHEVQHMAITDDLTGLHNRRGFFLLAEQQMRVARRVKHSFLVIFIDVDGLKEINDKLGHQVGDQALVEAAQLLKQSYRASDILARIGGDEFVVLAIDTPSSEAEKLMNRLEEMIRISNTRPGRSYFLSLSTGMAEWTPDQPSTVDSLLAQADAAMYSEKRLRKEQLRHERVCAKKPYYPLYSTDSPQ